MENFYKPLENVEIKDNARKFIRGRLWIFWQLLLVVAIIEAILSAIPEWCFGGSSQSLVDLIAGSVDNIPKEVSYTSYVWYYLLQALFSILIVPLAYGVTRNVSLMTRGAQYSPWGVLFGGYKSFKLYFKMLGLYLLKGIVIILWTCLLIVPGIIKALSYSQTTYILYDEPNLSIWEIMKKSEKMMQGYKGKFFLLMLSFIGWYIVGAFTFGILYVWLTPYVLSTAAMFYDEIRRSFYNGDPAQNREENYGNRNGFKQPYGDDASDNVTDNGDDNNDNDAYKF